MALFITPRVRFTSTRVETMIAQLSGCWPYIGSPPRVWRQCGAGQRKASLNSVHLHACGDNAGHFAQQRGRDRFTSTRVETILLCINAKALKRGSPPRVWRQSL